MNVFHISLIIQIVPIPDNINPIKKGMTKITKPDSKMFQIDRGQEHKKRDNNQSNIFHDIRKRSGQNTKIELSL